ncbi:MAG TPA: DUF3108 domain-containing protein [Myxococcaceae bacterium]|nr:DUF3108 domain-containing protein [Myxococcaceae bacterium]
MLPAAAVLALSLTASPACTLPHLAADLGWTKGERLTYGVAMLGGGRGGSCTLSATSQGAALELSAEGLLSIPLVKVRGSAHSWVGPQTLRPRRFQDELDGEGPPRISRGDFERPGLAFRVEWSNGSRQGMNAFVKGGPVFDAVSAIYSLRSMDLAPGAGFCFDVAGGGRYWRLSGHRAGGEERVDTPAGSFQAFRLEATATRADDASVHYQVRLWVSTDARRLPVALEVGTGIGPVRATLERVGP